MPTSYPGALDAFSNPSAGSLLTSPSHSSQHTDLNDAVEAIEVELDRVKLPGAIRAQRITSNQAITTGTAGTDLVCNSIIREDDEAGDITYSTSTGIATINNAGWYMVAAGVVFTANATGERSISLFSGATAIASQRLLSVTVALAVMMEVATIIYVAAAGTLKPQVFQTSGGNLNAEISERTFFAVARIR